MLTYDASVEESDLQWSGREEQEAIFAEIQKLLSLLSPANRLKVAFAIEAEGQDDDIAVKWPEASAASAEDVPF